MIEPGGSPFQDLGPGSQSDRPSLYPSLGPGSQTDKPGVIPTGPGPTAKPAPAAPAAQRTTAQAQPIPVAWGRNKLPLILTERADPYEVAAPAWTASTYYTVGQVVVSLDPVGASYECTQTGTSGTSQPTGKGDNISDGGTCAWRYVQDGIARTWLQNFIAALCEGPVDSSAVYKIWQDKEVWDQSQAAQWRALTLAVGDLTNSVVITSGGQYHYPYTVCLCAPPWVGGTTPWFSTGTQKEIPQYAAEIQCNQCGDTSTPDVNPALILADALTNQRYGARWSSSRIGDLTQWRTFCDAYGIRVSMVVDSETTYLELVRRLCAVTLSDWLWSDGQLKIIPLCDTASASPVYGSVNHIPSNEAVYDIDVQLDCLSPLAVDVNRDADRYNVIPVAFVDRSAGYSANTVQTPDLGDVVERGERVGGTVDLGVVFPGGTGAGSTAPAMISQMLAQRSLHVVRTYRFVLSWRFMLLEPTDVVTLTDRLTGITQRPVRITTIEETTDPSGQRAFNVTAEDYPLGVHSALGYSPQTADGVQPNWKATAGEVRTPKDLVAGPQITNALGMTIGSTVVSDAWFAKAGQMQGLIRWTGAAFADESAASFGGPAPSWVSSTEVEVNFNDSPLLATNTLMNPTATLYTPSGYVTGVPEITYIGGTTLRFRIRDFAGSLITLNDTTPWGVFLSVPFRGTLTLIL